MWKKFDIDLPQAIIASTAIVAFAAVYILAPDNRDQIEKAVLGVWAFISTFLGPMLRRRLEQ